VVVANQCFDKATERTLISCALLLLEKENRLAEATYLACTSCAASGRSHSDGNLNDSV